MDRLREEERRAVKRRLYMEDCLRKEVKKRQYHDDGDDYGVDEYGDDGFRISSESESGLWSESKRW